MKQIFITGGTGYIGSKLIKMLLAQGYAVKALVRKGSESKLPVGCDYIIANPFDAASFAKDIPARATFIQLLGVAHPSPKKKEQFKNIDLVSAKNSAVAAMQAGVAHFVYVSVALTPTGIMKDYQECRAEGENFICSMGLHSTFIRPWYVIGPGHYWPLLFQPVFKILEWIPSTSKKAKALQLVTLRQMLNSLLYAVEHIPETGVNIMEISSIRKM